MSLQQSITKKRTQQQKHVGLTLIYIYIYTHLYAYHLIHCLAPDFRACDVQNEANMRFQMVSFDVETQLHIECSLQSLYTFQCSVAPWILLRVLFPHK